MNRFSLALIALSLGLFHGNCVSAEPASTTKQTNVQKKSLRRNIASLHQVYSARIREAARQQIEHVEITLNEQPNDAFNSWVEQNTASNAFIGELLFRGNIIDVYSSILGKSMELRFPLVEPAWLSELNSIQSLSAVTVNSESISPKAVSELAKLRNVSSMKLSSSELWGQAAKEFVPSPNLAAIELSKQFASDPVLASIASLANLSSIKLFAVEIPAVREDIFGDPIQPPETSEDVFENPIPTNECHWSAMCPMDQDDDRNSNIDFKLLRSVLTDVQKPKRLHLTEIGLQQLSQLQRLQVFEIHRYQITEGELKAIGDLSHLSSLTINARKLPKQGLQHLVRLKELKTLEIDLYPFSGFLNSNTGEISEDAMNEIGSLTNLTSLSLRISQADGDSLEEVKNLKNLESFKLEFAGATDEKLTICDRLPHLTELNVSGAYVTDAGLKDIAQSKSLRTLNVSSTYVADAAMKDISKLEQLATLDLSSTYVTDAGTVELSKLQSLTSLNLRSTYVTDAGMKEIARLKNLVKLAPSTQITDAGISELTDLEHLVELDLSKSEVSDACLPSLETMTGLKDLNLEWTRVSNEGVQHLRKRLPNCKITSSPEFGSFWIPGP